MKKKIIGSLLLSTLVLTSMINMFINEDLQAENHVLNISRTLQEEKVNDLNPGEKMVSAMPATDSHRKLSRRLYRLYRHRSSIKKNDEKIDIF